MQLMSVAFVSETIQVKTNSYELMQQFMDRQRFIQYAHTRFNSGCSSGFRMVIVAMATIQNMIFERIHDGNRVLPYFTNYRVIEISVLL